MGCRWPSGHGGTMPRYAASSLGEMNPMVPAEVPSYWRVYFAVEDVDAAHRKALELGAKELLEPQDFPGGRFPIVSDPEGASVGLLKMAAR